MKNRTYKYGISLLIVMMLLLFGQAGIGSAQVETPTLEPSLTVTVSETATMIVPEESATATLTPFVTESATPVIAETSPTMETVEETSSVVVQILIQVEASADFSMKSLEDQGRMIAVDELQKLGIFVIEVPLDQLEEKIQELQSIDGVTNVELNDSVQALDVIPNDPSFGTQYALTAIRAPQGWELATGSSAVTIAIIDSGVDMGHIDLAGKLVAGYDFVNNDSVPQDDYGHGTHVAGIAAASGNNGAGIAGVSWGARIMPVKVLNASGGGNFSTVASGIIWAVDQGAQIINLSLGAPTTSFALQSAVEYAYDRGVLLVAASGNSGSTPIYCPACYPQVLAVGATNSSNQMAFFSAYGAEIDLVAPGQSIFSLAPGGYTTRSGTSMAAPHVSGLAAILYAYAGSAAAVSNAMQSTALDIGPTGWDQNSGAGLIQMDAAIRFLIPREPISEDAIPSLNGSGSNINPNGIFIPLPSFTPPADTALQQSLETATPTQTSTPLTVSFTPTPTFTATPTITPASMTRTKNLKVWLSPASCGGIGLILAGLALWWFARHREKTG